MFILSLLSTSPNRANLDGVQPGLYIWQAEHRQGGQTLFPGGAEAPRGKREVLMQRVQHRTCSWSITMEHQGEKREKKELAVSFYALEWQRMDENGTRTRWELRHPQSRTFQMLASFPYTTAMLLTLLDLMRCRSVWLSSSDTKPMKELSGVCAADTKNRWTQLGPRLQSLEEKRCETPAKCLSPRDGPAASLWQCLRNMVMNWEGCRFQ